MHEVHDRDIAPQGYRGDVVVKFADGKSFPLFFFEPTAVKEDLDGQITSGLGGFVAEPGLVVIPEISVANMKSAVSQLIEIDYFAHLRPVAETAANKTLNRSGG